MRKLVRLANAAECLGLRKPTLREWYAKRKNLDFAKVGRAVVSPKSPLTGSSLKTCGPASPQRCRRGDRSPSRRTSAVGCLRQMSGPWSRHEKALALTNGH